MHGLSGCKRCCQCCRCTLRRDSVCLVAPFCLPVYVCAICYLLTYLLIYLLTCLLEGVVGQRRGTGQRCRRCSTNHGHCTSSVIPTTPAKATGPSTRPVPSLRGSGAPAVRTRPASSLSSSSSSSSPPPIFFFKLHDVVSCLHESKACNYNRQEAQLVLG